jgi:hypothetical protein
MSNPLRIHAKKLQIRHTLQAQAHYSSIGNPFCGILRLAAVDSIEDYAHIVCMTSSFIVRCPHCGAKNRIPKERWTDRAVCGKCRSSIPVRGVFPEGIAHVSDWNFREEVIDFPGVAVAEFCSPA